LKGLSLFRNTVRPLRIPSSSIYTFLLLAKIFIGPSKNVV